MVLYVGLNLAIGLDAGPSYPSHCLMQNGGLDSTGSGESQRSCLKDGLLTKEASAQQHGLQPSYSDLLS